jgi:3-hydroxyisobutyrate dehydrogenase-like beta-hydroxyacid dehydrogenase
MDRVGCIGLGLIGLPIARRLLERGHPVVAHNRSRGPVEALVAEGATAAGSPAETAAACDVLLTSLPTPASVEAVFLGEDGAIHGSRPGQVFIDTSTVDPETSRRVGAALAARGIDFLDAPVSGGPPVAAMGGLSVMVGGDSAVLERVRPLLADIGERIFHCGPTGAGSVAKVCNQALTAVTHVLVAEIMVLGTRAGVDPRMLYEVFRASSGCSSALERAVPGFILPGRFEPAFYLDGAHKDLECAISTAKALGVRLLLPTLAQQCYQEARGLGHGREDMSAVIRPMEHIAGVEVRSKEP